MPTSGRERRDVLIFMGGELLGLGTYAAYRKFTEIEQTKDFVSFRTEQVRQYYYFLRDNGALETARITSPTYWFDKALVAADSEGEPKLIIPFKPRVTMLQVIGVEDQGKRSIRLTNIAAYLPNIRHSKLFLDLEQDFLYKNILDSKKLTDLPVLDDYLGFSDIHFWTRGSLLFIEDEAALEKLSFGVSVYYHTTLSLEEAVSKKGYADNLNTEDVNRIKNKNRRVEELAITLNYNDLGGDSVNVRVVQPAASEPVHGAVISDVGLVVSDSRFSYYLI